MSARSSLAPTREAASAAPSTSRYTVAIGRLTHRTADLTRLNSYRILYYTVLTSLTHWTADLTRLNSYRILYYTVLTSLTHWTPYLT